MKIFINMINNQSILSGCILYKYDKQAIIEMNTFEYCENL